MHILCEPLAAGAATPKSVGASRHEHCSPSLLRVMQDACALAAGAELDALGPGLVGATGAWVIAGGVGSAGVVGGGWG
jgi:hypothetical protein